MLRSYIAGTVTGDIVCWPKHIAAARSDFQYPENRDYTHISAKLASMLALMSVAKPAPKLLRSRVARRWVAGATWGSSGRQGPC